MAIIQTLTTSFKTELYQAVHNFGPASPDTFKIALYNDTASLGPETTAYSTTGEISGSGYTAGGGTLTISTWPTAAPNNLGIPTAYVSFNQFAWAGSLTARAALIYNATKGNRSVAILDFGANKTSVFSFLVTFPVADANSAIVRIS